MQAPSSVARKMAQVGVARRAREDGGEDVPKASSGILKRKEIPTAGSGFLKRTKMSVLRKPSLETVRPSGATFSKKARASVVSGTTGAKSVDTAQLATMSPVAQSGSSSAARGKGARKGPVGEMTVNFTLPSDFLNDNVLDETKLFPHLGNYLLPSSRERFDGFSFEKKELHAAGLLFLAFQASLALQTETTNVKALMASVVKDEEVALAKEKAALEHEEAMSERLDKTLDELDALTHTRDEVNSQFKESLSLTYDQKEELEGMKESLAARRQELEELKAEVAILKKESGELRDENKDVFSFARLTARAAIMRRHLLGKDPLASAQENLDVYLNGVGTEKDLDLDDEKDADEETVGEDPQGSGLSKDVIEVSPPP